VIKRTFLRASARKSNTYHFSSVIKNLRQADTPDLGLVPSSAHCTDFKTNVKRFLAGKTLSFSVV
jgi:hypothetical protein